MFQCLAIFLGSNRTTNEPLEEMKISGNNFEEEVGNFIANVLTPNYWEVIRWTRLPYLCEGDIGRSYYWLDDAVFVIKPCSS